MKLNFWPFDLRLEHTWTISSNVAQGGKKAFAVVFAELVDADGIHGLGEAAPSSRYQETQETVLKFLSLVQPQHLSFDDLEGSLAYLDKLAPGNFAAKTAINIALLDGAAKKARQPIYDFLKLAFRENRHVTSFTIGIDRQEIIEQKVRAAQQFPVLKLKVGGPADAVTLQTVRKAAPEKLIRVDANEAWTTKEQALREIETLAGGGNIEFVEQPMPANMPAEDWVWLRHRSPLPLFADESYRNALDVPSCVECFHGVNVKLVKTGGISGAHRALSAARQAGLKTMLGCMIESSVLITAAAHLAELTDYLDLDGNLLITNDPYRGATARNGVISFAETAEPYGLRVRSAT